MQYREGGRGLVVWGERSTTGGLPEKGRSRAGGSQPLES